MATTGIIAVPVQSTDASEFCAAMYPRLVGALGLHLGDRSLAEDVAQEALTRALMHWATVTRAASPDAWTFRVAYNLANSHFRRLRVRRRWLSGVASAGAGADPAGGDATFTPNAMAVRTAVAALPRRQREAIVLRYFADLSVTDAAHTMGCAAGTVKALTSQGIATLRAEFGDRMTFEGGTDNG